ncbi:hypothetical protein ACHAQH_009629 [Verticillium albo-atrum]
MAIRQFQKIDTQKGGICLSLGGCTDDAIYNLGFNTASYECYKDGERCGLFEYSDFTFVGEPLINLTVASISRLSDRPIDQSDSKDTGPFYSVSGDESTWVSNDRKSNSFEFQVPRNYSGDDNCALDFAWTKNAPFTYTVNFTNTTATALLTVNDPLSSVTLSFHGKREDGNDELMAPSNLWGQYSAIGLADLNENPLPKFTFTNDTEFKWKESENGAWDAVSESVQQAAMWRTWTYTVIGGGIMVLLLV